MFFFFIKQKTAYEMRISDWSSDVFSSDLRVAPVHVTGNYAYECTRMSGPGWLLVGDAWNFVDPMFSSGVYLGMHGAEQGAQVIDGALREPAREAALQRDLERRLVKGLDEFKWFIYRSEEHTSELQTLMRISYAVFCVKKKKGRQ